MTTKLYDVNDRAIYGCRQAGRHQKLMKKRKVWLDIYNSVSLFVNIVNILLPRSRLKNKKNTKGRQKLHNVYIRAIYGCTQVRAGHEHLKNLCCCLNMSELCFQVITKTTDSNQ